MENDEPESDEELRNVLKCFEVADVAVEELRQWLWKKAHDCSPTSWPPEVGELLERLKAAVKTGRSAGHQAFERYSAGPCKKLLACRRLTEEEFYLLQAMGLLRSTARNFGLSTVADYEALSMFYYEDDHRRGYIAPEARPHTPDFVEAGLVIQPDTVRIKFLRPEQEEFLRIRLPGLYQRFLRD